LEETIRSVLLQGYHDLEYIIMDGGSTDNSLDIIRRYEPWLSIWVSEKDKGYADALNKGFAKASGAIRAWQPASDTYMPGAFHAAQKYLGQHRADVSFGEAYFVDEQGKVRGVSNTGTKNLRHLMIYARSTPVQSSTFWRKEIQAKVGSFRTDFRFAADRDWFLRLSVAGRSVWMSEITSRYRTHGEQLSSNLQAMLDEGFIAWKDVLRANNISQLQVLIGTSLIMPIIRFRTGGLRSVLRLPKLSSLANVFLGRHSTANKQ
jgi:glycosyltransferase involved in cell wall biosynthesis